MSSYMTIIYVNYFCSETIHQSISSFKGVWPSINFYVLDNSGDYQSFCDEFVMKSETNVGYLNGFVTMAKLSKSRLICLCNPDITLQKIDFESILAESAKVIAPSIIDKGQDQNPYKNCLPSRIKMVANFFLLLIELIGFKEIRKKIQIGTDGIKNKSLKGIVPHGACILFKDCDFSDLYSSGNNLFFEEERIGFWAKKKSYEIIHSDNFIVNHSRQSPSTGRLNRKRKICIKLKSLLELMFS